MKLLITATTVLIAMAAAVPSYALDENSKKYDEIAQVSDVALKAIEVAKPVFDKENPRPGAYTVDVIETDHLLEVSFCLKSQAFTRRIMRGDEEIGKQERCPGHLTVQLDKQTFRVLDKLHSVD